MIGGKSNSRMQPSALGSMLQASTYGQTITLGYGLMKTPFLAVWAQNLRQGGSGKKFKNKKKGQPSYVENIDFMVGHNPIVGMYQAWVNATKLPLNFEEYSTSDGISNGFGAASYTIPDPLFYGIVGVTVTRSYSFTFNDYGSPGSVTQAGDFEIPLWNLAFNGPDPTNASGSRQWPFVYKWEPTDGATVYTPTLLTGMGLGINTINIYYAQLSTALRNESPAAYLRLTWEPILADGPEYGTEFADEQVLMPPFAGLGSPNFDLGSSGAIPDTRPEILFPFGVYPSGDADFADMIEDIVKSGPAQTGFGDTENNQGPVQHGCSCFDWPGPVQKVFASSLFADGMSEQTYLRANVKGNVLVAYWQGLAGSTPTFESTAEGATWNVVDSGFDSPSGFRWNCSWVYSLGSGPGNIVSLVFGSGALNNGPNAFFLLELPIDTFDTSVASTFTTAYPFSFSSSITTGNAVGQPAIVLAFFMVPNYIGETAADPRWGPLFAFPASGYNGISQIKTVWGPGAVPITDQIGTPGGNNRAILLSFKQVAPSAVPQSFGNFIDDTTMQICRAQARAYGLWGALSMQTQKPARDWMTDLYSSMNCAPFFSGGLLKQMPYGEVSLAANGAIYTAPTSAGPVANLSDANGDFITKSEDNPPVTVKRKAQFLAPAILQYQIPARSNDYNPVDVTQPESGSLSQYGVRKSPPETHNEITDPDTARVLLGIKARRAAYIRNVATFDLSVRGILWEPMDFVTLTEKKNAMAQVPYRFTSVTISNEWGVSCEAEPYIYGVHGPLPVVATDTSAYSINTMADPGNVNAPILFEPVPRLYGSASQAELWAAVSSPSPDYGGCYAFVSTDGGNSYNPVNNLNAPTTNSGAILGNGITGYTTADWPSADDPDTTNNLGLNLSESLGILSSYMAADRDAFTYPCYVGGGSGGGTVGGWSNAEVPSGSGTAFTLANAPTGLLILFRNDAPLKQGTDFTITGVNITLATTIGTDTLLAFYSYGSGATSSGIPYGLMTYNDAVMTGANQYTLTATGAGNDLRRCVFGAPVAAPGPDVDHPVNSRFAFLGNPAQPNAPGLMKLTMDPTWIGKTLYFKFLPFNTFGNTSELVSDLVAYPYTPTGIPGGGISQNQQNYVQTPAVALTQPSGTQIDMADVSVQFATNTVNYNARTFTIVNPSVPTVYYVTIADSSYAGDVGAGTTLVATCQTSDALVGVPGNTYIGFIIAVPGGGAGATAAPGGWPAPQSAIVTP